MRIGLRRRRVVINTVTGKSFVGELRVSWPWQYRMRSAEIVDGPGGAPTVADGDVVVPRRVVEFVQYID